MPQKLDKRLNAVGGHRVTEEQQSDIRARKDAIRTAKGRIAPAAEEVAKPAKPGRPAKPAA